MKSQTTLLQVACAALLASSAGFAAAADSTTLAVTATVTSLCKFSATSTSLAFGAVYP